MRVTNIGNVKNFKNVFNIPKIKSFKIPHQWYNIGNMSRSDSQMNEITRRWIAWEPTNWDKSSAFRNIEEEKTAHQEHHEFFIKHLDAIVSSLAL